jgi:hypothetical protein
MPTSDFVGRELRQHRRFRQPAAARDRRNDRNDVPALERCGLFLQVADVVIVDVDVDEAPQPSVGAVEVMLERTVAGGQVLEQFTHRLAIHLHGVELVGERPQRCRNKDLDHDLAIW